MSFTKDRRRRGGFKAPPFPYHHKRPEVVPPKEMAENMLTYEPLIFFEEYPLRGYFPRSEHIPRSITFKWNDQDRKVYVKSMEQTWKDFDVITDHYTEEQRVKTRINYTDASPFDYWRRSHRSIIKQAKKKSAAEGKPLDKCIVSIIFKKTHGAGIFRPSQVLSILHLLYPDGFSDKKILHPSAGWGPILAIAGAFGMEYTGVDPNLELKPGHSRMIEDLGDFSKQEVIYEPFEDVKLIKMYDIVIWSPPYFDFELYSLDSTQSVVRYPKFEGWMNNFLLPATVKAWNHLVPGGYMIIHLADSKMYSMSDRVNDAIENCGDGEYLGVIAVAGECPKWRPTWVWRKLEKVKTFSPPPPANFNQTFRPAT